MHERRAREEVGKSQQNRGRGRAKAQRYRGLVRWVTPDRACVLECKAHGRGRRETEGYTRPLGHVSSLVLILEEMGTMQGFYAKKQHAHLWLCRGGFEAGRQAGDQDETKQLMESTYCSTWQSELITSLFPSPAHILMQFQKSTNPVARQSHFQDSLEINASLYKKVGTGMSPAALPIEIES